MALAGPRRSRGGAAQPQRAGAGVVSAAAAPRHPGRVRQVPVGRAHHVLRAPLRALVRRSQPLRPVCRRLGGEGQPRRALGHGHRRGRAGVPVQGRRRRGAVRCVPRGDERRGGGAAAAGVLARVPRRLHRHVARLARDVPGVQVPRSAAAAQGRQTTAARTAARASVAGAATAAGLVQ